MEKSVHAAFADGNIIRGDGYHSYISALESYTHEYSSYDPDSDLLYWMHIVISNAKAFIMVCPKPASSPIWMSFVSVSPAVSLMDPCWSIWF